MYPDHVAVLLILLTLLTLLTFLTLRTLPPLLTILTLLTLLAVEFFPTNPFTQLEQYSKNATIQHSATLFSLWVLPLLLLKQCMKSFEY
jgi:cobalamin synthase